MNNKYFQTYHYLIYFLILFFVFIILNDIYYTIFILKEGVKVRNPVKTVKKGTENAVNTTTNAAKQAAENTKKAAEEQAKKAAEQAKKIAEKLAEELAIQKELAKLIQPIIIFKNTLLNSLNFLKQF